MIMQSFSTHVRNLCRNSSHRNGLHQYVSQIEELGGLGWRGIANSMVVLDIMPVV